MNEELEQQEPIEQEQPEPVEPVLFEDDSQESEEPEVTEGEQPEAAAPDQRAPKWVSEMRKNFNGALKDKSRLERELEELRAKLPKPEPALAAKPTLDQYDYDETRFSEAYDKWMEQKAAVDRADQAKLDAQRQEQEAVANFQKSYAERKKALGVEDFDEAEAEVGSHLNQTQAGLLMRGADDPAVLVYALSKSPARLMDLAKITDPVKFTVAVAKMELSLSMKSKNRPAPEARITPERASTGFNSSGAQLEKLRDEAARTGDFSKVVAYKRQIADKSK